MFHAYLVHVKVCNLYFRATINTVSKNAKRCYNYLIMQIRIAAEVIVSILSIIGSVALGVRWMVKHYLSELRPNSGSSLKDQVNRLEQKVEIIYDIIMSTSEKPSKRDK